MQYSLSSPSVSQESPGQLIAAQDRFIRDETRSVYDGEYDAKHERKTVTFGMVPEPVFALGGEAIALYAVLARHANKDGECWPSMKTICETLKWSPTRARPALAKLLKEGLVEKRERKLHGMDQSNIYRLTLHKKPANVQVVHSELPVEQDEPAVVHSEPMGSSPRTLGSITTNHELEPIELDNDKTPIGPHGEESEEPDDSPEKPEEPERRKRATAIPHDFALTVGRRTYAIGKGFDAERTELQFERFVNHAKANDRRQVDWDRSWQNWVLGEIQRHGISGTGVKKPAWNSAKALAKSGGLVG